MPEIHNTQSKRTKTNQKPSASRLYGLHMQMKHKNNICFAVSSFSHYVRLAFEVRGRVRRKICDNSMVKEASQGGKDMGERAIEKERKRENVG